jgi:putative phage-type endonuclease
MIQGSDEWKMIRLGKVTASRVADVVAKTKTGWGASRANLMAALVAERLTGVCQEAYTNGAMAWGTATEPQARAAYEFHVDVDVEPIAFVEHPTIPMAGCSPDGLVGADGLLEIKCPNVATHIATLLGDEIDGKYVKQMQWQMACTGRQWCDFVSFDPRMPPEMQLHVCRVQRDQKHIDELQAAVIDFLAEVAVTVERLRTKYQPAAEAA